MDLEGLPKTANIVHRRNFINSLNSPVGPTQVVQDQMIIDSYEQMENEVACPGHLEVGTPNVTTKNLAISC